MWQIILTIAIALPPDPLYTQTTTATILGTIRDPSGAAISNAYVTATNEATGLRRVAVTGPLGDYVLTLLPIGRYSLTVEAAGFKKKTIEGLVLEIDQKVRVDVDLEPGEIVETITVVGATPLVRTETAEIGEVIENKRIVELPLNGRLFLQLAQLTPGVTESPRGGFGQQLSGVTGPRITVMGARESDNSFTLDGVSVMDRFYNTLSLSPAVDAIQEFKVQSNLYSAELGSQGGAHINIALKSGTNEWHGTIYEFLRNDALDARNFFDPREKPEFKQNQFGWTLGGPIRKDQIFFFGNFEGLRLGKALTRAFTVPTSQLRAGDFAGFAPIRDPQTGQPFPGNRIPPERIHPASKALLELVPLPNRPGLAGNLVASPVQRNRTDQFNLRMDYRLTTQDTFFGRYSFYDVDLYEPFGFVQFATSPLSIPGFGQFIRFRAQNVALNYAKVFTPRLIGEFRFGFLRTAGGQVHENVGNTFNERFGIKGTSRAPSRMGIPRIVTGIFNTWGDVTFPITRRNNDFQYDYNLSYAHTRYVVKLGVQYKRLQFNPDVDSALRGQFTFTGMFTGNAFADFLLGLPQSALGSIGSRLVYLRGNEWHAYLQQDWKATPRLTMNIGIRYDYFSPLAEKRNRWANLDIQNRRLIIASQNGRTFPRALWVPGAEELARIPIVTSEEVGINRALYERDLNNWAPRFGFAYTLTADRKTILRGGYGVFYNQITFNAISLRSAALPFFKSITAFNSVANPIPLTDILADPRAGVPSWSSQDMHMRTPYFQQWNLSLQRSIWENWLLEAAYAGSKGTKLYTNNFFNVPSPGPGPIAPRRLFPQFGPGSLQTTEALSNYHGLILRAEKRLSRGLMFMANYTFSKCIDLDSLAASVVSTNLDQDPRNKRGERALCNHDARHRFVLSYTYDLPSLTQRRGFATLLNGWQIGGIVTLQSGQPFTVNITSDRANIGVLNQRPNVLRNPNLPSSLRRPERWFDTAAFVLQPPFTFGNAGRNILTAPGIKLVDLSLLKSFTIRERHKIQFRTEFFNAFNHVNFDYPERFCGGTETGAPCQAAAFGRILAARDPRILQFAMKYVF
jgi:hypothetical protein